jgi:hypothetical protein
MRLLRGLLALLVLVVLATIVRLAFDIGLAETIPPDALTRTRMTVTEVRIRSYYAGASTLPNSLAVLPVTDAARDNNVTDGWGRPMQYRVEGTKVTLTSFGRDGRPGGRGKDSDIVTTFSVQQASTTSQPSPEL